ncbi:NAD-dependent succinate-semialdehyde dehydrogenase [Alteromonas halophila]|uniref:NAD-dependent succinate-semialdehyde dehydrogenase n=1 Tax=Alteromonas halophila TaxID=516698 RepID=A0A918JMW6_9ALTE|nr:NAD-dependent succinate-semialdehyde dehydrogenase [Alteromonas halophila]GGW91042.1 NAD-dependent succinate-semialdehyde dehydrogenase [Alteromonas halophila]
MTTNTTSLMMPGSLINGEWHESQSRFTVRDKASGAVLTEVSNAQPQDMARAVDAAHNAFASWRQTTGSERSKLLMAWYNKLVAHRDELAELLCREQGKPLAEAKGEIDYGAGYVRWFAGEAERINGDILDGLHARQTVQVVKKPVGVVGAITPWNFPNAMIARKAAAALAAGCTFVGRPASETPLSALAMAALAEQAGVPPGVLNMVTGTDSRGMGEVLTQSEKVAKFSFTGSTRVGQQLIRDCASTVKRVSMELGGNAPFIVFSDADIEAAVKGAMLAKFRNAGQTCVCANRFLVQADCHDAFVDALSEKVAALTQGNGLEGPDLGPLISEQAAANVNNLVSQALEEGADKLTQTAWSGGAFYPPTLLTGVTGRMAIFNEEIFGPVVTVTPFTDEDEAVRLANQTEYGLAAYLYTQDYTRMQRVASQLDFGMVGINDAAISNPAAPFGGVKQSGFGREGSRYGLDDYLSLQYRCLGGY